MANAVKTKDLAKHAKMVGEVKTKRKQKDQGKGLVTPLSEKTFSQLTGKQKDDLLKACALELGLIAPD